ncbi:MULTISPECIES: hypothetical protein [unclassified Streptomyces]|uniref:hypothetical protein n=1 Tax=unclassified Streptomyces TaxID=2593676 RepID=UPI002E0FA4DA|nr:hypothetical protein OG452_31285 [Streptomyces sp. NBC_01197]WSS47796.1 hypothetical protein OG708_03580 [Streptomyces sp. NBC_01180]
MVQHPDTADAGRREPEPMFVNSVRPPVTRTPADTPAAGAAGTGRHSDGPSAGS